METLSALLALCEGNPPNMVDFLTKDQWCGDLTFYLLLGWTSCWRNSQCASDKRCHDAHVTSLYCVCNTKKRQEIFALIACPVNSSSHKWPKMWNCLSWKFIVMNRISEALVSGWNGSSEIKFISNLKIASGHDLFRQPIIILSSNMERWTTRDQESTTIHKNKIVGLVQCRPNSTT